MRVLLTNDDGVSAAGLKSLRAALLDAGFDVGVIAPAEDQSGRARAVTCLGPVELCQLHRDSRNPVFACSGTPVDCVRIGILSDLAGSFDVVASGINHGVNLGDDSTVSGTLGAALEGALLGHPSIAISQQDDAGAVSLVSRGKHSFEHAPLAAQMVSLRARSDISASLVFNLNIPNRIEAREVALTRWAHFRYRPAWIRSEGVGEGSWKVWPYAHPGGSDPEMERVPGTDITAIERGSVSLTLVASDWSDRQELAAVTSIDRLGDQANAILHRTAGVSPLDPEVTSP